MTGGILHEWIILLSKPQIIKEKSQCQEWDIPLRTVSQEGLRCFQSNMGYCYCSWCPKRMRWEDIIVEDTVRFEYGTKRN